MDTARSRVRGKWTLGAESSSSTMIPAGSRVKVVERCKWTGEAASTRLSDDIWRCEQRGKGTRGGSRKVSKGKKREEQCSPSQRRVAVEARTEVSIEDCIKIVLHTLQSMDGYPRGSKTTKGFAEYRARQTFTDVLQELREVSKENQLRIAGKVN
jgi:hypothetical protein